MRRAGQRPPRMRKGRERKERREYRTPLTWRSWTESEGCRCSSSTDTAPSTGDRRSSSHGRIGRAWDVEEREEEGYGGFERAGEERVGRFVVFEGAAGRERERERNTRIP